MYIRSTNPPSLYWAACHMKCEPLLRMLNMPAEREWERWEGKEREVRRLSKTLVLVRKEQLTYCIRTWFHDS